MATVNTVADALGLYHTGASFAGATQNNPNLSLGGERAANEAHLLGFEVDTDTTIPAIRVDWVSPACGEGSASITVTDTDADEIAFTAPSGTQGTAVAVTSGNSAVLEDTTASKAVRVARESAYTQDLIGTLTFDCQWPYNSIVGFDNVASAERAAGHNSYRAIMLRAHGAGNLTNVKAWVETLGTQADTDSAQLGASGSGTITTTGSFSDWPTSGWAHIKDSGGSTREIIYYTSRTATSLTVPAGGRARLGTSAGAGAGTDTVDAVPGIRLALEAPSSAAIQVIASDTTAPTGLTWDTGTTSATGVSTATLNSGDNYGLWIHREIPDVAVVSAQVENKIGIEFTVSAVTYTYSISGYYRIADSSLDVYELYVGEDADPDLTATADATSATLPFSHSITPPGSGTTTFYSTVLRRNSYNLASLNAYIQDAVEVDNAGAEVTPDPQAPTNVALTNTSGGFVTLSFDYYDANDPLPADKAVYYISTDGDNPNTGTDTANVVTLSRSSYLGTPFYRTRVTIGPYAKGTDLRVLVRTRRTTPSADSTNTTATTTTVSTMGPALTNSRGVFVGGESELTPSPLSIDSTTYIDQPNNIRYVTGTGYTDLYWDTTLVYRLRYDSNNPANNGLWTTFGIKQETTTGASTGTDFEVASTTIGYVPIDSVRRIKFDIPNALISIGGLNAGSASPVTSNTSTPIKTFPSHAVFQVYDPATGVYQTALSADSTGALFSRVGWRQRQSTTGFD